MSAFAGSRVFDALHHQYWHGARQLRSVTGILKAAGLLDVTRYTAEARERGLRVHRLTAWIDRGDPRAALPLEEGLAGYVAAYRAFLLDVRPAFSEIELPRFHPMLDYGGRPDRACSALFGEPAVLEIKTGEPEDWHGVQLAGYQRLCPQGVRIAVYLRPTGRYKLQTFTSPEDDARFLWALNDTRCSTVE